MIPKKIKLIVGLGNYPKEYEMTKHNAGFLAIDKIQYSGDFDEWLDNKKLKCKICRGIFHNQECILIKPQTYMNSSGEAVKKVVDFYKIDSTQNLIVISDDINLDIGRIRIRKSGSAGGHNGLKNIIAHLKSEDFTRVRVGVGENGGNSDLINHVLGKFSKAERTKIDEAAKTSADAILDIIEHDEEYAMNKYNS